MYNIHACTKKKRQRDEKQKQRGRRKYLKLYTDDNVYQSVSICRISSVQSIRLRGKRGEKEKGRRSKRGEITVSMVQRWKKKNKSKVTH